MIFRSICVGFRSICAFLDHGAKNVRGIRANELTLSLVGAYNRTVVFNRIVGLTTKLFSRRF
jgi:hypothetical protein